MLNTLTVGLKNLGWELDEVLQLEVWVYKSTNNLNIIILNIYVSPI